MTRTRSAASIGLVLALILGTLAGCQTQEDHTVGAVLALTGTGKTYGDDIKKGMEIELEKINQAGGIGGLPLKIVYEDSKSDPAAAAAAAARLIEEHGVAAIVGGVLSSETLAIAPVAEAEEVVLLSPASSSPQITGSGTYVFRIYPSDVVEGTMMADFTLNVLGKSRIMIVAVNNDYGQGLKAVYAKRYRTVPNREIIKVINFPEGISDWSAHIAEIKQLEPEAIYLVGYPQEMLGFLEALRELAWDVPVLAARAFDVEMLKVPAAEGVIFPRDPFNPERTQRAHEFAETFRQKHGAEPNIWSANGADAVGLIAEAIGSAGGRAGDIQAWMANVREWDGASGIISFDRQGDVEKLPVISIVHQGDFIGYNQYRELIQASQ